MSLTRRWLKRLLPLLLLGGLLAQASRPARAHPADMYTQTYVLRVGAEGATLDYGLSPGPLLAASTWYEADTDGDDQVSAAEARAWLAPLLAAWQSRLGEANLDWTLTAVSWPTTLTAFELGDEQIAATLTTAFVAPAAGTPLTLQNDYAAGISIHWFYVYGEDGVTFTRPEQANGRVALALTPPGASPAPLGYWDSGTPALAAGTAPVAAEAGGDTAVAPAPAPTAPEDRRPYAVLTDLVRRQEASPLFLLTALGISLVLGAMHGLTPGHGKALVAAYLVGSRGTPRHAAALGGVVTLTHTGSVLAVGLLTLAASRFLVPTDLFPILELASGLLIMAMGVGLLVQRWRGWRSVRQKRAAERAAVVGEARRLGSGERRLGSGERGSRGAGEQGSGGVGERRRIVVGADIPVKVYDGVLAADAAGGGVRWRALLALGVSGGLVPCPDAIAILLVAVAINRIALGLSLIVSFSLGLAVILIAIGLAMVHSRRLLGRFTRVERLAPAIAVASAVIVLGLGVALTWRAASGVGVLAQAGVVETAASPALPASAQTKPRAAGFSPGAARVLYQVLDAQGMYQLFSVPAAGGEPRMLTQTPFGIWNYAIAPDGQTVVYAALRADRGSDLWAMDAEGGSQRLLLACPEAACRNVTFAPDGGRLVYERLDISPENVDGAATLWSLDVAGGETAPVFQDASLPGFSPAWSPDGRWLSYISPGMPTRIQLYDLTSGRGFDFVTLTSMRVVWEPAGRALLLTDVDPASLREGQQALTHLLRFDVDTEALVDISGRADVSDSWPAWSADGEWVAFVRRVFADGQPERGNQVWVMRADGREARQVTAAENALHQNPVWSADGRFLLYHRYNLAEPLAKPAVWLLDVTSGDAREVVNPGSQPAWLAGAEP